jgi:hypothetical protein
MYEDELMYYEGIMDQEDAEKLKVDVGPVLRRRLERYRAELARETEALTKLGKRLQREENKVNRPKGGQMAKTVKAKRAGFGLEMRTFRGTKGTYIVFRDPKGEKYHTFIETEAKAAAKDCGSKLKGNPHTRDYWNERWANVKP